MTDKAPEIITLKALCAELKIDPKEARERLRDGNRPIVTVGNMS